MDKLEPADAVDGSSESELDDFCSSDVSSEVEESGRTSEVAESLVEESGLALLGLSSSLSLVEGRELEVEEETHWSSEDEILSTTAAGEDGEVT